MRSTTTTRPMPRDFLEWQVALRHHTMHERNGAPHVGVAPLVSVRRSGIGPGMVSHSVICGLLPTESTLAARTAAFREIYEEGIADGARKVYDRGIAYMLGYYVSADDFDAESITTLVPDDLPIVDALRAEPRCALVFYVFDLEDRSEIGRLRCVQLNASAEVLREGPVFDNVWWHNTLFHGKADGHVVIRFRHESSFDTRFGRMESL